MPDNNTLIDDAIVVGKLNWQGNHLYLGKYFCGSVWPSDSGKNWHSVTVGNCTIPYDDEKSARDGLVKQIKDSITDNAPITSQKICTLVKFAQFALPMLTNASCEMNLSDSIKIDLAIGEFLIDISANVDIPIYKAIELLEDIRWELE
jgi:hypothetical protein